MQQSIPELLLAAIDEIYLPSGIRITKSPVLEKENTAYAACALQVNRRNVLFRIGKITPKKIGHFVAVYTRVQGIIVPLDALVNHVDFLVVDVSDMQEKNRGQFIFPKKVLVEKGIFSEGLSLANRMQRLRGKLSFRVFAPWEDVVSHAKKTQNWQQAFFFPIATGSKEKLIKKEQQKQLRDLFLQNQ